MRDLLPGAFCGPSSFGGLQIISGLSTSVWKRRGSPGSISFSPSWTSSGLGGFSCGAGGGPGPSSPSRAPWKLLVLVPLCCSAPRQVSCVGSPLMPPIIPHPQGLQPRIGNNGQRLSNRMFPHVVFLLFAHTSPHWLRLKVIRPSTWSGFVGFCLFKVICLTSDVHSHPESGGKEGFSEHAPYHEKAEMIVIFHLTTSLVSTQVQQTPKSH